MTPSLRVQNWGLPQRIGKWVFWQPPPRLEIMFIGHFQAVPPQVLPKHGQKVTSNICLLIATSGCAQGVQRKWQDAATDPWVNFWGGNKPWPDFLMGDSNKLWNCRFCGIKALFKRSVTYFVTPLSRRMCLFFIMVVQHLPLQLAL